MIENATADQNGSPSAMADMFDHFTEAKAIYQDRYGSGTRTLQPVAVIAGDTINASKFAPPAVAGFALGDDMAKAEKICTTAGHSWQKVESAKSRTYSCSGPDKSLDVPVTVELAACAEIVCKVQLNGNPDGASWETVVPRFVKLAKGIVQVAGKPHEYSVRPHKDCKTEMEVDKCLKSGQAQLDLAWKWADDRILRLTTEGANPGTAPTLSLVYRSP